VARWVGAGVATLLAVQALAPLLRPPAPPPLAADIGLPRPQRPTSEAEAIAPASPAARAAISPARALAAAAPTPRRGPTVRRRSTGRKPTHGVGSRPVGEVPATAGALVPVAPAPTQPAGVPAGPPPASSDGSEEFAPH